MRTKVSTHKKRHDSAVRPALSVKRALRAERTGVPARASHAVLASVKAGKARAGAAQGASGELETTVSRALPDAELAEGADMVGLEEALAADNLGMDDEEAAAPAAAVEADAPEIESTLLAEVEAVAEEAPEAAKPAAASDAEPANFLALYFKEMAALSVLRPEEEFKAAKHIEELELELWNKVFSYPLIVEHVLRVVERTLDNSLAEFKPLRAAVRAWQVHPAHAGSSTGRAGATPLLDDRIHKAAVSVSQRVRALDIDKRNLDVVLDELRMIARGDTGLVVPDRLPFSAKTPQFRKYLSEVAQIARRAQRAKNEFVKANLRLVVSIARRFNHGRMPLSDLIQEGNIGLIKAVERFDYRRGYRFSTYASWWIRHAISRALADKGRAVRLPVHMIDAYHRVARSKRELTGKLGRQPTPEEIGTATGIAAAKIEKMRSYLLDQSFSLDRPVSDEDGRKFIDFVQDPNADELTPADRLADAAMSTEVRKLLEHLKPIEADILRQRFGLDEDRELTLKEIGEKYNLSRERIRQLQEQALTKMRRALARKDLM